MNSFRMQRALLWLDQRPVHFVLIALCSLALALALHAYWPGAKYLDDLPLDGYFLARGAHDPSEVANSLPHTSEIVLIETSYLMPRPMQARLLEKLKLARVVAFDFMFVDREAELREEEKPLYENEVARWRESDGPLAQAIRQHGRVILGTWPEQIKNPSETSLGLQEIWQRPPKVLWDAARWHGHLAVEPGVTRHVALFQNTPQRTPSLGLAIAAAALGITPEEASTLRIEDGVLQMKNHRAVVGDEWMRINYVGGRESFESLENHAFYTSALEFEPEDFKDKIVIVGESSYKSKEILDTPFGPMPGMQIHANVVATLLSERGAPRDLPLWGSTLLALGACLFLLAPLLRWPLWASFFAAILVVIVTVLVGAAIFVGLHRIAPFSIPLLTVFFTYNAVALYEYRRARETLGRFIGREMVAPTLNVFSRLRLGGRVEEASAMFCDLRGYTALSEQLAPDVTARLIGEYTSTLVNTVRKHKGRPIDYQGDGVFVLFEPALCGKQYARNAVEAAVSIHQALDTLREKWRREGAPAGTTAFSIGIETGEMMIGLIGAEEHLKPGAIGDAINVASRVQQLSITCGYPILITSTTLERAGREFCDEFGVAECGWHAVRGRQAPLEIYGIGAPAEVNV